MSASDRYQNLETKVLSNGKVVYKPAKPNIVRQSLSDVVIIANERDRLDIIANNVYDSPNDWWRLAALNGRVNGSLFVKPGTDIRIPTE
jgi:hypothetical protein